MQSNAAGGERTRLSLSATGCVFMYSTMFPLGIQSETSWRGSIATPSKGRTFGCAKRPNDSTSLQKTFWIGFVSNADRGAGSGGANNAPS